MGKQYLIADLELLPQSKNEALKLGKKLYFTKKSCKNGHLAPRNLRGTCLNCSQDRAAKYRIDNPDKIEEFNKKRKSPEYREKINQQKKLDYEKNPKKYRMRSMKNLYGLSEKDFNEIWTKQGNKCAICNSTERGDKKSSNLNVDHDHVTKKVRGILCSPCNKLLGDAKDDPLILDAAIDYLKQNS